MVIFDNEKLQENIKPILIIVFLVSFFIIFEIFSADIGKWIKGTDINANKLVINEIMSSNKGSYVDENGNSYDWLELYNGTNYDINLANYTLSDDESTKSKWTFPSITIKAKEYLIIYLAGIESDGLYTNFALSKDGGELLSLKNPSGKVINSVRTEGITKNTVMIRDENGEWIQSSLITPGFSNSDIGRKEFLTSLYQESSDLVITEFLPNNKGNMIVNGEFYGYIEIKNHGNDTIELSDYFLSNDINRPFLWNLPNIQLKKGEIYVIYASELDDANNTNFFLKKRTGIVILSNKNKIVDKAEYENLTGGYAYIKHKNNEFIVGTNISPGYENNIAGVKKFLGEKNKNKKDLIISEIMSSNSKYLAQNGNNYYDWIELYNNSNHTINLKDYSLTTDEDNINMYKFVNKELKAGEFYIIMASGNTALSNKLYKHTNFKISSTESLYLYKNNKIIDAMFITNVPIGYSYGRNNKNGFYYFSTPTPGSNNKNGIAEISHMPIISIKSGVYNNIVDITVEISGLGSIYYTLDGSEPTKNSKVYNNPITLSKTTVVRAVSYENGKKASDIVTSSYIINENHTLPVVSISLPPNSFSTISNAGYGDLTLPAHAELYENGNSFSVDCGFKLFGGDSRYMDKKSFSLKFSSKYGPTELEYKVFNNRESTTYKTLVLRSGSQDSIYSMFRDELATSIMDDYGTVDVQAYKPVILYINGKYWGIYYLREKVDAEFIQNHYNVDSAGTNIFRVDGNITIGSRKTYLNLLNFVNSHDMTVSSNYEYVKTKLDIDNFIDFWIGQGYVANEDIRNMRFFSNPNVDNEKFKMIYYDLDYAFFWDLNYLTWMTRSEGLAYYKFENVLIRTLMTNKEFKQRFLDRLSYNLNNVWSDKNVMNRYNELYKILEPEMARNQIRWGMTLADWDKYCKELEKYLKNRRKSMLKHIRNYFDLNDKDMKKYFE